MALYNPTYSSDRFDVFNYIEDYDVFNSELILRLTTTPISSAEEYKITKYADRLDLITKDIFGDYSYCMGGLITMFSDTKEFALGETINYLSNTGISGILSKLNYS